MSIDRILSFSAALLLWIIASASAAAEPGPADLLFIMESGTGDNCYKPYRFQTDIDGNTVLVHENTDRRINVNINALIGERFVVERGMSYWDDKTVNVRELFAQQVGRDISLDIRQIVEDALRELDITHYTLTDGDSPRWICQGGPMNQEHLRVMLRVNLDTPAHGPRANERIASGDALIIKVIPQTIWLATPLETFHHELAEENRSIELLENNENAYAVLIQHEPLENYNLISAPRICSTNTNDLDDQVAKLSMHGSVDFISRFRSGHQTNPLLRTDSLNDLWIKIQSNECPISIISGAELTRLRDVLRNDQAFNYRLEFGREFEGLFTAYINQRGFQTAEAFYFSQEYRPALSASRVNELQSYGITSLRELEAVIDRADADGYASRSVLTLEHFRQAANFNPQDFEALHFELLMAFLEDEKVGTSRGISASQVKEQREAEQARAEAKAREAESLARETAAAEARRAEEQRRIRSWKEPSSGLGDIITMELDTLESRLAMVVRTNSCSSIEVVWGFAIPELFMRERIYEVNGQNVIMEVSTISQLGLPFVRARSRAGRAFLVEQFLATDRLTIKDEDGREESFIARDTRDAHQRLISACEERRLRLRDAL